MGINNSLNREEIVIDPIKGGKLYYFNKFLICTVLVPNGFTVLFFWHNYIFIVFNFFGLVYIIAYVN